MTDIALRVEGLGKRYRLGLRENPNGQAHYRYKSLRDSLGKIARRPLKTLRNSLVREPMSEQNSFWALKDINLQVKRGEVVGIIGRNGAGKSTLLKILSRITKPTTGQVDLFGRVGSLLEVGTGFHPELSGRENIYLNGAILGMTRAEVRQKFDEIVAFSEVEKFLDTAVKQYSSGMHMRLAFAVAAHLDPEVLIVDEVLAVGDAQFQKKCLGKMKDVAGRGRTVLFVSHDMAAIRALSRRAVLMESGRTNGIISVEDAVAGYLAVAAGQKADAFETGDFSLSATIKDGSRNPVQHVAMGDGALLEARLMPKKSLGNVDVWLRITRSDGILVSSCCSSREKVAQFEAAEPLVLTALIRPNSLYPANYSVSATIRVSAGAADVFVVDNLAQFQVLPERLEGAPATYNAGHGVAHVFEPMQLSMEGQRGDRKA
jgi:ABC-type polysaccharide/polyol phosphate transport system ATPase subunit